MTTAQDGDICIDRRASDEFRAPRLLTRFAVGFLRRADPPAATR